MSGRAQTLRKLKSELELLKRTLDLGRDLEVKWIPGCVRYVNGRKILGEVRGDTVFVYAKTEPEAILVLRHEVLEHTLLEKFTIPYKRTINLLLGALEEQNYFEKEKLVKKLTRLIWREDGGRRGETGDR